MTEPSTLQHLLSRKFCEAVVVRHVPSGFAISSPFTDNSGDRLSFYATETDGSYVFEDDGSYLSHLVAKGIDIERGQRKQLLDGVLAESNAYWDSDTFEIRSHNVPQSEVGDQSVRFLSALLRIRDLELLTKEMIRSTFKEDATAAIQERFKSDHAIEERAALAPEFNEYPADLILRPKDGGKQLAVFFVNSPTQFLEAELLHGEIEKSNYRKEFASVALIEDTEKLNIIGMKRFQRAVNRGMPTPIFRGDEAAAMSHLRRIEA